MELSPEYQKLILDFVMAVISGGVAGLIAGVVLLRMQIRSQLTIEDEPRVINLLQALDEARDNLEIEMAWQDYLKTQPDFVADKSQASINEKRALANEVMFKLGVQAEHLRSKEYYELRVYLSLRKERSLPWGSDDPAETLGNLTELIRDIGSYYLRPRGVMKTVRWFSGI